MTCRRRVIKSGEEEEEEEKTESFNIKYSLFCKMKKNSRRNETFEIIFSKKKYF